MAIQTAGASVGKRSKTWRFGFRALGLALIPLLSFFLMAAIYDYTVPVRSAPEAKQGVIDLSDWEFGMKQTVLLDGEWIFYPLRLYKPEDFRNGRVLPSEAPYAMIPNAWGGSMSPADEASGTVYGTYRLIVKLKDEDRGYGIRLPNVNGAHRLYVNGDFAGQGGNPSDNERDYVKENKPYMTFVHAEDGMLDIVLQSANWNPTSGGFEDVQLGLQSDMLLIEQIHFAVEFAGLFILLLFAGYHMSIYVLRTKDKAYLYSSLYFLTMLIIMATFGENMVLNFIPGVPYWVSDKLYDFGGFTNIVVLGIFLHYLDAKLLSRRQLFLLLGPIVAYLAAVIVVPQTNYELFGHLPWYYATFVTMFYLYRVIRLFIMKDGRLSRQEVALLIGLLGSIVMILLVGMLYSLSLVETDIGRRISLLAVLAFMDALLALRLTNATNRTEQLTDQLILRDKLKDEFLANTSHELKTPLHGIQNIASFLLADKAGNLTERQRSELSLIQDTSTKLSALVNDLTDVVRLKHGDLQLHETALDLRVASQTAYQVLEFELAGKEVRWEQRIPLDTYVRADENRIRQVLYNLIHNAIKHTKKGSITIGAHSLDGMTTVWVEDTGIGIPKESHEMIFGYFEQAEREMPQDGYTGMGLGLYISRQLIERMGGRIWVDWSEPGQGTRFAFTLPTAVPGNTVSADVLVAASRDAESPVQRTQLDIVGEDRSHTVLVVDDEASNVRILLNLLGDEYNVLTAFSAQEALRKLEDHPEIDLVILDVMMPEMSGIDLCRTVRESRSLIELPVLFATVKDSLHDIELCFRAGGSDFIAKPFDPKTLSARVRTQLSMKSSMDQALRNEMAFLQAQIKPHFLYNAISSIVSFCYTDGERAAYLLSVLSRYLRMVFEKDQRTMQIPLGQELELIRAYVEIEKARFGDRLVYRLQTDPELETYLVPSLTIQPFVENAIRHGLFEKEGTGTVSLSVTDGDGYLRFDIADDGVGMPDDMLYRIRSGERPDGAGIGMTNVRRRLASIPGTNVSVDSELDKGTKVTIYLPKNSSPAQVKNS